MEACVTRLCIHFLNGFRSRNDPCKHLPQLFHSQDRITNSPYCLSYQFLESQFGEYGIGSTNISLINIFLSSHSLSAWYCVNIVTGNSILVTLGSWKVNTKESTWSSHFAVRFLKEYGELAHELSCIRGSISFAGLGMKLAEEKCRFLLISEKAFRAKCV